MAWLGLHTILVLHCKIKQSRGHVWGQPHTQGAASFQEGSDILSAGDLWGCSRFRRRGMCPTGRTSLAQLHKARAVGLAWPRGTGLALKGLFIWSLLLQETHLWFLEVSMLGMNHWKLWTRGKKSCSCNLPENKSLWKQMYCSTHLLNESNESLLLLTLRNFNFIFYFLIVTTKWSNTEIFASLHISQTFFFVHMKVEFEIESTWNWEPNLFFFFLNFSPVYAVLT